MAVQTLQPQTQQPEQPNFQEKKMGEEATVSGLTFKVNSSKETKTLTAQYSSPKSAKDGTKFILVDLSVINQGSTDATFFPNNNFMIVDSKGRQYTTYDQSIGSVDNYLEVRKLAAGVPEEGLLVYEVPENLDQYGFVGVDTSTSQGYVVVLKRLSGSSTQENS